MAEATFSRSMNVEDLCTYLEQQGLVGDDLQKIREAGYNGKNIFYLANKNYEELYRLKMKDASVLVLKTLLEENSCDHDRAISSDQTDAAKPTEAHRRDAINHTALTAANECERFSAFGLGHGVDASEPAPLKKIGRPVRFVLPDFRNSERMISKEENMYERSIDSITRHSSSVTFSVSDIVGKVLTLSAEAEYTREKTKEVKAKGTKIITGRVAFTNLRPRCSHEQHSQVISDSGPHTDSSHSDPEKCSESNFERELCEWFMREFPESALQEGNTCEDKVNNYLRSNQEGFNCILAKIYHYVKTNKLTHYVSTIELGALKYSLSVTKKCCCIRRTKGEAGVDYLAGVGAGACANRERNQAVKKVHCIGNMDEVHSGKGEAVIGYELSPIFWLVCHRHREIKRVLQRAIFYYLKRNSGPFTISCLCKEQPIYWTVDTHKSVILGTSEKNKASIFYIEKQVCPGEFNITYYGENFKGKKKVRASRHLTTKSKMGGPDEGPLQVGGGRAANLTLRHPARKNEDLGIEYWESDACFIRLAPRRMQKKSYVGFDVEAMKTVYLGCREEEGEKYIMRFNLTRVEIECSQARYRVFSDSGEVLGIERQTGGGGGEDGLQSIDEGRTLVYGQQKSSGVICERDKISRGEDGLGSGADMVPQEGVRSHRVVCDGEWEEVESAGGQRVSEGEGEESGDVGGHQIGEGAESGVLEGEGQESGVVGGCRMACDGEGVESGVLEGEGEESGAVGGCRMACDGEGEDPGLPEGEEEEFEIAGGCCITCGWKGEGVMSDDSDFSDLDFDFAFDQVSDSD